MKSIRQARHTRHTLVCTMLLLFTAMQVWMLHRGLSNGIQKELGDKKLSTITLQYEDKATNADSDSEIPKTRKAMEDCEAERLASRISNIANIVNILQENKPQIEPLKEYHTEERIPNLNCDSDSDISFTEDYLSGFLKVSLEQRDELMRSHSNFLNAMRNPTALKSRAFGSHYFPAHEHESRKVEYRYLNQMSYRGDGIVYVGGLGHFNWLALLSIKHLRAIGSTLPVEVLLPRREDYEPGFCYLISTMNGNCVVLEDYLGTEFIEGVKKYQLKSLALLISSFERVLLLDADNIPVHNPDILFHNGPLSREGLVIWPDYWRRTTSPEFYRIADIDIPGRSYDKNNREVPVHDRAGAISNPSSESGQLLMNKGTHWGTLLLSLYYNYHGPDYYYPLLSQGAQGEGDKETFISAAVALKEPFYQVKEFVKTFGYFNGEEFKGNAIGQVDPVQDEIYQVLKAAKRGARGVVGVVHLDDVLIHDESINIQRVLRKKNLPAPSVLFLHANTEKLDPARFLEDGKVLMNENGERRRLYGPGMKKAIGYDIEWSLWEDMRVLVCESRVDLQAWKEVGVDTICKEVLEQLVHLEESAKDNEK